MWNCWMIKTLLHWLPGMEDPQLDPSSFLLLQWWHQRISRWQQPPRALLLRSLPEDTRCVALEGSPVSGTLEWLMAGALPSWPPSGRGAAGIPSCAQPSTAQDGGASPWKGFSRCAGEGLDACARANGLCVLYLVQASVDGCYVGHLH